LVGELLLRKGTVNVYAPVVEKLELEPALLKKYVMVLLALVPVITTLPEFEVTVLPIRLLQTFINNLCKIFVDRNTRQYKDKKE
jgi:hypothetical protein